MARGTGEKVNFLEQLSDMSEVSEFFCVLKEQISLKLHIFKIWFGL